MLLEVYLDSFKYLYLQFDSYEIIIILKFHFFIINFQYQFLLYFYLINNMVFHFLFSLNLNFFVILNFIRLY